MSSLFSQLPQEPQTRTVEEISAIFDIAPEFLQELEDQEITEGQTVTLTVRVKGHPAPEIKWSVTF